MTEIDEREEEVYEPTKFELKEASNESIKVSVCPLTCALC